MSEQHHGRARPEVPSEHTDPLEGLLRATRRDRRRTSTQAEESEPLPRPPRERDQDDYGGEVIVVRPEHWLDHMDELMDGLLRGPLPLERQRTDAPNLGPPPPGHVVISHALWWFPHEDELEAGLRELVYGDARLQMADQERLTYSVEEAAKKLGISRAFAYECVQQGLIPHLRMGKRILIPKSALHMLVESAEARAE